MKELTLSIEGMTCNGCANNVTQALQAVPGVESAQVSLAEKRATIRFDDTRATPAALKEAVEAAGFDVVGA